MQQTIRCKEDAAAALQTFRMAASQTIDCSNREESALLDWLDIQIGELLKEHPDYPMVASYFVGMAKGFDLCDMGIRGGVLAQAFEARKWLSLRSRNLVGDGEYISAEDYCDVQRICRSVDKR